MKSEAKNISVYLRNQDILAKIPPGVKGNYKNIAIKNVHKGYDGGIQMECVLYGEGAVKGRTEGD